jgi:hypothetical protein
MTFAFGLVHGFGFAGALAELIRGGTTAVGIGSFNLGIELAQIGVALALVPVLYRSTCSRVGAHLIGWLRR